MSGEIITSSPSSASKGFHRSVRNQLVDLIRLPACIACRMARESGAIMWVPRLEELVLYGRWPDALLYLARFLRRAKSFCRLPASSDNPSLTWHNKALDRLADILGECLKAGNLEVHPLRTTEMKESGHQGLNLRKNPREETTSYDEQDLHLKRQRTTGAFSHAGQMPAGAMET